MKILSISDLPVVRYDGRALASEYYAYLPWHNIIEIRHSNEKLVNCCFNIAVASGFIPFDYGSQFNQIVAGRWENSGNYYAFICVKNEEEAKELYKIITEIIFDNDNKNKTTDEAGNEGSKVNS